MSSDNYMALKIANHKIDHHMKSTWPDVDDLNYRLSENMK